MKTFGKPFLALLVLLVTVFGPVACGASEAVVAQTNATPVSAAKTGGVLSISTTALPSGVDRNIYLAVVEATGGTPGYTWAITAGHLPSGLTLIQTTGLITGVPKQSGTSTFTLTASDKGRPVQTVTKTFTITTLVPLAITTFSPSSPVTQTTYSTILQASGGTAPYMWSISSGRLPSGLTLDAASGRIAGTPGVSGTSTFSVTVIDHGTLVQNTTKTFSINTIARLAITTSLLASPVSGFAYSAALQDTGGVAPYQWSVSSGSLPAGLSLNASSGLISGTPTADGTSTFVTTVTDSGNPVQSAVQAESISVLSRLSVPSVALPSGISGEAYAARIQVSGGVPAYTWSIVSGNLPSGLSLAATTGVVSGTPNTAGTFNFAARVVDNGSPTQAITLRSSIKINAVAAVAVVSAGTTWYVRADGGTRYTNQVTSGQCDGKSDTAYSGVGINQHCAFNDFRYLWDDDSGTVGAGKWVIAGGDTVIVRGCTAGENQSNAVNPDCRLGWDRPYGDSLNRWCYGVGSYSCMNPPIPAGTASQHTRILGQNYASCNTGNDPSQYVSRLTQLFGGFSLAYTFNLQGTQNVDVQCIELTTHNGVCTTAGSPAYPRPCNNNQPLDDFASNGFVTDNTSANITLQDVYVHGFNASGLDGPIGGVITMTRVNSSFNAFAGWNFADQLDTPNATGSAINAHYVTMIGNGCYEEYPVVHAFSAQACYDDVSNGFGDAWSGQDTDMASFVCDHCVMAYNTKDAFIGPHANVTLLTITDSQSYGNMGAQWKWNNTPGATTLFANNLTVGNCLRMGDVIPGAAHTFAKSSGLPGAYLSDFCRAGGNTVAINSQANSTVNFTHNTFVDYLDTVLLFGCGPASAGGANGQCGSTPFVLTDNIFLGYHLAGNLPPGLIYLNDHSIKVTQSHNLQFGNRTNYGEICTGENGNICGDPRLIGEPDQQAITSQFQLDNVNFHLTQSSPAIGSGLTTSGILATDFYGTTRATPPSIGAVEP